MRVEPLQIWIQHIPIVHVRREVLPSGNHASIDHYVLHAKQCNHSNIGQTKMISNKKFAVASLAVDVGEAAMGCDLISTTIHNQVNGAQLTDYEVFAMIALVLLVGRGTIVNFLPLAMEYLARHPRDFAQLSANPQKIPQQVAKMLRHFPVVAQARLVTKDLLRDDVELKSRDMVLAPLTLYGVNERVNPDPMHLNFT